MSRHYHICLDEYNDLVPDIYLRYLKKFTNITNYFLNYHILNSKCNNCLNILMQISGYIINQDLCIGDNDITIALS